MYIIFIIKYKVKPTKLAAGIKDRKILHALYKENAVN